MKVLITGGAGFLGSNLCKKFLDNDYEVICLDNLGSGRKENIYEFINNPRFKFIEADVSKDLSYIEKVDLILHLQAAQALITKKTALKPLRQTLLEQRIA